MPRRSVTEGTSSLSSCCDLYCLPPTLLLAACGSDHGSEYHLLLGPLQGIDVTALREIKILRELHGHPNIVNLEAAWAMKKNVLLVR